jgi:hypothetical protein
MTKSPPRQTERVVPYLYVDDVGAYQFLSKAFGFETRMHDVDDRVGTRGQGLGRPHVHGARPGGQPMVFRDVAAATPMIQAVAAAGEPPGAGTKRHPLGRMSPSWATDATSVPSRVKRWPIVKPRAPCAAGLTCA